MEATRSSETLVTYTATWCHKAEDHDLNIQHLENSSLAILKQILEKQGGKV